MGIEEMDYVKLYEIVVRHEKKYSEWITKIKRDIKDVSSEVQYDEAQLLTDISQLFRELGDFAQELQDNLDVNILSQMKMVDEWIAKKNNQSIS